MRPASRHRRKSGSDRLDLNIAGLNGHDGNTAFRLLVSPVRVVCANTQAAALRDRVSSWSIRHTRNAKAAVQQAREALGLTFAFVEEFQAEAERLINTTITDAQFHDLVRTTFGNVAHDAPTRARNAAQQRWTALSHLFHEADTQAGIRNTAWAGYQSVVTSTPRRALPVSPQPHLLTVERPQSRQLRRQSPWILACQIAQFPRRLVAGEYAALIVAPQSPQSR